MKIISWSEVNAKRLMEGEKISHQALMPCNLITISLGKKCTYSSDGTKVWSYVWLHKDGKPADIQKINCN